MRDWRVIAIDSAGAQVSNLTLASTTDLAGTARVKGAAVELRSTTDFTGKPRIQSRGIDIGAFEARMPGICIMVR